MERLQEVEIAQIWRAVESDVETVDRAAKELRESPGIETLETYKDAIRRLLKRLLEAYTVDEKSGFTPLGKRRVSVLLRIVDHELDELAHMVLGQAQDTLKIASKLDDIRGLIFDHLR